MAQLIVRNLEEGVRDRLRELAARHGRSMEEEVREILRAAVVSTTSKRSGVKDLGAWCLEPFATMARRWALKKSAPAPSSPRSSTRSC